MLQTAEIKKRFSLIENEIDSAENIVRANTKLPQSIKESVTQWKKHAMQTKAVLDSDDSRKIVRSIDDLEALGDGCEKTLRSLDVVDARIRDVVTHAHHELADLKAKLH